MRRFTEVEREEKYREMYRLYSEEGWLLQDLADEYGLHRESIRQAFHRRGWALRRRGTPAVGEDPGMTDEERRARDLRMRELYNGPEQWTLRELADEFGIQAPRVWRIFRRNGWDCRRRGRRPEAADLRPSPSGG